MGGAVGVRKRKLDKEKFKKPITTFVKENGQRVMGTFLSTDHLLWRSANAFTVQNDASVLRMPCS